MIRVSIPVGVRWGATLLLAAMAACNKPADAPFAGAATATATKAATATATPPEGTPAVTAGAARDLASVMNLAGTWSTLGKQCNWNMTVFTTMKDQIYAANNVPAEKRADYDTYWQVGVTRRQRQWDNTISKKSASDLTLWKYNMCSETARRGLLTQINREAGTNFQ